MIEIENTGERILLAKESPLMIARHSCAYRFARDYVSGKQVLDIGCGEGYGSNYLAQFAENVTAIDYNEAVIKFAREKYPRENLCFSASDAANLGSLGKEFDVVCCFQVIEHIKEADSFLEIVNSLLRRPGIFICSTPNRLDASPHSKGPANKFHVKEYFWEEFSALLKRHFSEVRVTGLKRGVRLRFYRRLKKIGVFNFLPLTMNPVNKFYRKVNCDNFILVADKLNTALDFIAVCRK